MDELTDERRAFLAFCLRSAGDLSWEQASVLADIDVFTARTLFDLHGLEWLEESRRDE